MLEIRKADERGLMRSSWLHSRPTFSFGQYYDPAHMGFSDLRVINDDIVAPGRGFGMHPHQNMEIVTYVLTGALEHRDSTGAHGTVRADEVQIMSAGTGIMHSEMNPNPNEPVHLLQIWILPGKPGLSPRHAQMHISQADKNGRLRPVLSPDGAAGTLQIHQDVHMYVGLFDGAQAANLELDRRRCAYVHVARGSIMLNQKELNAGDGVRVRDESSLQFSAGKQAEVLVFDLRPENSAQAL